MAKVRPLSDLPKAFARMANAAAGISDDLVPPLAKAVEHEVDRKGGRFYVRGRNGNKVRLEGKVRKSTTFPKKHGAVREVHGNPPGFWRIIEEGSSAHLIAGRYRSNGRRRSARAASNQFLRGDSFAGSSPINIPGVGWRQNAVHPGHGSVGRPWRKAMDASDRVVTKVVKDRAGDEFRRAWLK